MSIDPRRIALLGAGKIGEALVSGLLSSGWREPREIVATARRPERLAELRERHGIRTTLANAEAASGAGQVLLSEATAASVPRRNRGRVVPPGFLLRGAVEAELAQVGPDTSPTGDLNQFISVGQCDLLIGGEVEPEHRPAAVAFIHFHQFDEVIEREGLVVAAERLDQLVRSIQAAADSRGVNFLGSDISARGGKIILTAGAPSTTGNDEELMLQLKREERKARKAAEKAAARAKRELKAQVRRAG